MQNLEAQALELLEPMASMDVIEAAKRAVTNGTHTWTTDAYGNLGLVEVLNLNTAVIVIYHLTDDPADFEVDEEWLEA